MRKRRTNFIGPVPNWESGNAIIANIILDHNLTKTLYLAPNNKKSNI